MPFTVAKPPEDLDETGPRRAQFLFYRYWYWILTHSIEAEISLANCRAATPYLYPAWSINRGSCFMDNRRTKRSSSGYRPAKVSFAPDDGAHFCVVHNGSDQGLCIELTFEARLLPDHFELSFDNFRTVHSCRIVWQEDNIAGVAFDRRPPQSPEGRRAKLRIVT